MGSCKDDDPIITYGLPHDVFSRLAARRAAFIQTLKRTGNWQLASQNWHEPQEIPTSQWYIQMLNISIQDEEMDMSVMSFE